jgi:hypothetical protein
MSVEEPAKTALSGFMPWVPWIAGVIVAGLVGGGIGLSGLAGHETQNVVEFGAIGVSKTTPAYSCPGGVEVATLNRGERVLALSRNDDASWVSVRDPRSVGTTVWVPVRLVIADAGEVAFSDLPLGDPCPTVSLPPGLVEEAPPAPAPAPAPAPGPAPAPDTTPPVLSGAASTNPFVCVNSGHEPQTVVASVNATDNVGIASVTAKVGGSALAQASHSGNNWGFTFGPYTTSGSRTVTFTAKDAAGNTATTTLAIGAGGCVD